ncbi:vitamin K-dependent protein C-like [Vanessa cardui]|uniref:vitamin K-dependent protein C-like n=1 Tax=Vanessa cardui TaxID=171605 RepID=UPI001F12B670|nr:vitamin K-dependent protein C-like [Vanessa cardui]
MPWLARIYTGTKTIRGTLISDRHVITAANPLFRKSASEIVVTLGSQTCKEGSHALNTSVEAILIHPGYSGSVRNNDIALLRLRNPIQFSSFISPICMPLYDIGKLDQLAWTASKIKTKSDLCLTRVVTLPILSTRNCKGNTLLNSSVATLSDKGCLGPLGTKSVLCENDIGGPVMTRWAPTSPFRLAGIITKTSCEEEMSPQFTRTVDNMLWIHENIRKNCQCF